MSKCHGMALAFVALLCLGWLNGCTLKKVMVGQFVGVVETGMPALEQNDDLRLLAQALPSHLVLLETLLANDPHNAELLVLLSRSYGAYAFAVLETEWEARRFGCPTVIGSQESVQSLEQRISSYFAKGKTYALEALDIAVPQIRRRLRDINEARTALDALDRRQVPALFWYGFNLGGYVQHNMDDIQVMSQAYLVEKAMNRVIELDPSYYHGNAHLILLVYYASRSPMMGGNLKLALDHYEQHRKLIPQAVPLREMFWARYYLVQEQQREACVKLLGDVVHGGSEKELLGLLDRVAVTRARIYLSAVDRLFD